jgi:lysophospholipase L1-like esterase
MRRVDILGPAKLGGHEAGDFDLNPYALRLLAEGDSWFSLGSIPAHNLLMELRFAKSVVVLNLAYPGDEVHKMFRRMWDYGAEFANWMTMRSTYRWDAILLSGGGNDLIAAFPHLLRADIDTAHVDPARPQDLIDAVALAQLDRYLVESYIGFVNCRDRPGSPNANVPMIVHTYDYPTPNNAPALAFGLRVGGPWIYPQLNGRIPREAWVPLTDFLLDHVAETLLTMRGRLPNFFVVDTRGTLRRAELGATGASNQWENEIHPSADGYRKLAVLVAAEIVKQVPSWVWTR